MPKGFKPKSKTEKKTAGISGIEESQAEKFLAQVPEEHAFWSNDGRIFRDMQELKGGLESMSDQTFAYHCNESKKDFSNWVRNIIGDEKLAHDLENVSNREEAARIVAERYGYLIKAPGHPL